MQQRKSVALTSDVVAIGGACLVLFGMYRLPPLILAQGQMGAVWPCHAVFGLGVICLSAILHFWDKYRYRVDAFVFDERRLPEQVCFCFGRYRVPCGVMAAAGAAWVSACLFIMAYAYFDSEDKAAYYSAYFVSVVTLAVSVAIIYVQFGRIADDPGRAVRGGLVLDRAGLTFDGWYRRRLFWQQFAEVLHEIENFRGKDSHYLKITLHEPLTAPEGAAKWPHGPSLRYPLAPCRDRPEVIVATLKAFLERARREQGFLPARPTATAPESNPA